MNIKKVAIPVVIVLILLIAGISAVSYFNSQIDLTEFIEIETVHGLNGQGVLEYSLKTGPLADEILGDTHEKEITEENFEAVMSRNYAKYEEIDYIIDCITLSADKEGGLSNGDTVTVTASFKNTGSRKIKHHFKDGSTSYTVSGLLDGKAIDPFDEDVVSVTFSGLSGQGEAVLAVLSSDEPYSLFTYQLSQSFMLSNGEEITLKASANEQVLEEKGYFVPESMEKTVTVTGLGEYFDFTNEFPAAELSALCDKALATSKEMEAEEIEDGYMIIDPSKVHKAFSLQVTDPSDPQKDYGHNVSMNNAVCVITSYYMEGTGFMPLSREEWTVSIYPNYYLVSDGLLMHEDSNNFNLYMLGESIEEIEQWLFDEYDQMIFTELSIG